MTLSTAEEAAPEADEMAEDALSPAWAKADPARVRSGRVEARVLNFILA